MKGLIRFFIRRIPRPVLIRLSYTFSFLIRIAYRGNQVECPVCGSTFRKFLPYGVESRDNVLCPKCLSLERHRGIWLYMNEMSDILTKSISFLHVAPEQCFQPRFKKMKQLDYLTADLESPLADMHFDIHKIPFEDHHFDLVMCNHVLEHVEDDLAVMKEIHRVLKPGGKAILQVPQDYSLNRTQEDPSVTDPAERERLFKQKDHLRLYGTDYPERLRTAGFEVEEIQMAKAVGHDRAARYRLADDEILYISTKAIHG